MPPGPQLLQHLVHGAAISLNIRPQGRPAAGAGLRPLVIANAGLVGGMDGRSRAEWARGRQGRPGRPGSLGGLGALLSSLSGVHDGVVRLPQPPTPHDGRSSSAQSAQCPARHPTYGLHRASIPQRLIACREPAGDRFSCGSSPSAGPAPLPAILPVRPGLLKPPRAARSAVSASGGLRGAEAAAGGRRHRLRCRSVTGAIDCRRPQLLTLLTSVCRAAGETSAPCYSRESRTVLAGYAATLR